MKQIFFKEQSYAVIGKCMDVFNQLGTGFSEIVYKDALEFEFRRSEIKWEREKRYEIDYKGIILPHAFYADFVVFDSIILEIKHAEGINDVFVAQAINYLKASGCRLALVVNFGETRLTYKRIII